MKKLIYILSALVALASCTPDNEYTPEDSTPSRPYEQVSFKSLGDAVVCPWIELGLPSGNLWLNFNMGTSHPDEFGDYYAWAETSTKTNFSWSTYTYWTGGTTDDHGFKVQGMSKYTTDYDDFDIFDDAAYAQYGENDTRVTVVPTLSDWQELIDNTEHDYVQSDNGNILLKLTSKINGVSIYLPCAGVMDGTTHRPSTFSRSTKFGAAGWYWTSGQTTADGFRSLIDRACYFEFDQYEYNQGEEINIHDSSYERRLGMSIRPVRKYKEAPKCWASFGVSGVTLKNAPISGFDNVGSMSYWEVDEFDRDTQTYILKWYNSYAEIDVTFTVTNWYSNPHVTITGNYKGTAINVDADCSTEFNIYSKSAIIFVKNILATEWDSFQFISRISIADYE